jgi:capsular exopolysaccharide synthesis family protein
VDQQLASLQSQIKDAQDQIKVLDGRLPSETTARGVQDIQSQTTALQQKIASWQSTYATLLQNTIGRVNNLTIVDPATSSEQPISPNVLQNVLAAATIGFALAAAGVLVMELLDDTLKSQESVAAALRLPLLGAVGRRGRSAAGEGALVALHHPASSLAESYRVVRTGIQFAALTQPAQVLVVSSAIPGEGKSTTAANLAISMASAGQRVLLCDGDLRLPTLGSLFQIEPNVGLTDLLLDDNKPLDMAIVDGPVAGLRLVARGPMPPNAAEVLGSPAMRKRIEQMREAADVVIFDSPALLAVADATILAGLCDSVVLVVDAQRTRRGLALRARSMLERLGLPILGVVLNRAPGEGTRYRAYYGEQVDEATSRGGRHRLGAGLGKLGFER